MKSTYSVAITATICYDKAEWQVRFTFPAAIDFDAFDSFIEDIESREGLPSIDDMIAILQDYYFDDEPDIKKGRIYKLSLKEFNAIVHGYYDDDSDMFADCMDSIQPSFCRNCGAEGQSLEPDAYGCTCDACGQDTLQSLAASLNII